MKEMVKDMHEVIAKMNMDIKRRCCERDMLIDEAAEKYLPAWAMDLSNATKMMLLRDKRETANDASLDDTMDHIGALQFQIDCFRRETNMLGRIYE